jgi:hypothetical protein
MKTNKDFLHRAVELLMETRDKGWKQENAIVDTSWGIPIETLWDIERFLEKYGARDDS